VFVRWERGTDLKRNANLSRVHIVERHNSHDHRVPVSRACPLETAGCESAY
jgi:hypothetical protein